MGTALPTLRTDRLELRPFAPQDLPELHRILCDAWGIPTDEREPRRPHRERWLTWTIAGYRQYADLDQPPYGERAVVRRDDGRLVGVVGVVPSLGPFGSLRGYPASGGGYLSEVGLFWAVDPAQQGRGYASEAARGLADYLLNVFGLARVIATTQFDNAPSRRVMRKLGMREFGNETGTPEWFQVVGLLERDTRR